MPDRTAIIIGAGPAGLTAAYELIDKTDIHPVVLESSREIGGIARTVRYKGNRIDIGGHRFFSKSDRVMDWWRQFMPLQGAPARDQKTLDVRYQGQTRSVAVTEDGPDPEKVDRVMLVRNRLSRIFYLRRFFAYPLSLNFQTMSNLGPVRIARIGASLIRTRLSPIKNEKSLQDFFINRFGRELYLTFFKDYTEKVWGVPCDQISAEWGAQRIKGLSLTKAVIHALKSLKPRKASKAADAISQKDTETSLIERFLYPKHGPGQLWEHVTELIRGKGARVEIGQRVVRVHHEPGRVTSVETRADDGSTTTHRGDFFFSSMPMKDLINAMGDDVPADVKEVANGLVYRDFITVGLLLKRLKVKNDRMQANGNADHTLIPDNWIYIQERDVKIGRLQIFNNWSPYLVADPNTVWMGLEYFCNEGDELWRKSDEEFKQFAIEELSRIDIIEAKDVLDGVVIRVPKTYPAYFGSYDRFDVLRKYLDRFENLFLIGRNGMHRYNNQDHSMLTAMTAVENIRDGIKTKDNIWEVNTEMEYHEEKRIDSIRKSGMHERKREETSH